MNKIFLLLLTGAFAVATFVRKGEALDPETKDSINNAAKPIQRGAQQAVRKLENLKYGQRSTYLNAVQGELDRAEQLQERLASGPPPGADMDANALNRKIQERATDS